MGKQTPRLLNRPADPAGTGGDVVPFLGLGNKDAVSGELVDRTAGRASLG